MAPVALPPGQQLRAQRLSVAAQAGEFVIQGWSGDQGGTGVRSGSDGRMEAETVARVSTGAG
jgi:hypothetical protein